MLRKWIRGSFLTLVVFALVNAALYFGQEFLQGEDEIALARSREQMHALEEEVEGISARIDVLRSRIEPSTGRVEELQKKINDTKTQIDFLRTTIREQRAQIAEMEGRHPQGIPQKLAAFYRDLVAERDHRQAELNGLITRHQALRKEYAAVIEDVGPLMDRYQALILSHNQKVDAYNREVIQFNRLVARAPLRRFLLPGGPELIRTKLPGGE